MPALTARAQRAVGVDLEVADLGAEAVRAPQHLAPGDDAAADAGAERDQQHLGAPARGAVHELGDHRDVGVVVDDRGEPTTSSSRARTGARRNAGTFGE